MHLKCAKSGRVIRGGLISKADRHGRCLVERVQWRFAQGLNPASILKLNAGILCSGLHCFPRRISENPGSKRPNTQEVMP